jgi:hypothetical protein
MELVVVNAMVMRGEGVHILRSYIHDNCWNRCDDDWSPRLAIHAGRKPVAIVITVPGTPIKIDAEHVGNHIDIGLPAGNDYYLRRWRRFRRRRRLERLLGGILFLRDSLCLRGRRRGRRRRNGHLRGTPNQHTHNKNERKRCQ